MYVIIHLCQHFNELLLHTNSTWLGETRPDNTITKKKKKEFVENNDTVFNNYERNLQYFIIKILVSMTTVTMVMGEDDA